MKKTLLFTAALLISAAGLKAQVSYGFKAGANFAKINVSSSEADMTVSTGAQTSFYVGAFVDAPIATNFSFQPGLSLQGKGGKVSVGPGGLDDAEGSALKAKTNLMYLEVPLNFVYYIPTGDAGKVFVGVGPYVGYGLRVKAKVGDVSKSDSFKDADLKPFDFGGNFMLGYKLNNGLFLNGGYGLGLSNVAKESDEKVKNRVFSLGLGFQL